MIVSRSSDKKNRECGGWYRRASGRGDLDRVGWL